MANPSNTLPAHQVVIEAILDNIGSGLIATDEHGKIMAVNEATVRILGFSKDELLGSWYPKVIPAESEDGQAIDPTERPNALSFASHKPESTRCFYTKKDGTRVAVSVTAAPILIDGKPSGGVEIFEDITEQLKTEQELKKNMSEIKRMNEFMTGRELRMNELKIENEQLKRELEKYQPAADKTA